MKQVNVFFTFLFITINTCRGLEPAQICHVNPTRYTDMCMAVKTVKSQHERGHDLLMTFSVKFHEGIGWAAFGVGDVMERALMFVLWPGEQDGDIVLSLRSTTEHVAPKPLKNQRQVHVHSTEMDQNGFHILKATCYSCETVGLGPLNATTDQQSWLFATSYLQQTKTNDPNLRISMHTDYGLTLVDMAQSLSTNPDEDYPAVSTDRSLIHAMDPSGSSRSGASTYASIPINMWNAHGLILSFSVVLNCFGILLIRSGFKWAFRGHWIVQALSAFGLMLGGFIGIFKSTSVFHFETFASLHKLIGVAITIGVPVQVAFGYRHHLNYLKFGQRTRVSLFHIYLGRALFIALNVNVFMGLLHAGKGSALKWMWVVIVFVETLALGGMMFARRTNAEKGYKNVEGDDVDPFVIGEEEK